MFAEDSFFSLSLLGRTGLLILSLALAALTLYICAKLCKNKRLIWRLAIALVLLFLFIWLSPQIYYSYYLLLFEGLPIQIVIKTPPTPIRVLNILFFSFEQNLSAYSIGLLGWALIFTALRPLPKR